MTLADDVTVIIPAFNSQETIAKAITSCLDLSGSSLIVVDDGSTDRTADISRAAGALVIQQENAGAWAARNRGLSAARTRFIVFLDADDELLPVGVLKSLTVLREDSTASVAAGRVLGVMPNGSERLLRRTYDHVDVAALLTKGHGPWPPAASVIRRDALREADALPIESLGLRYAEDYEMFIRLSQTGRFLCHDQPTTRYRLFAGKSSKAPLQEMRDKETIRAHYSAELRIAVHLMTPTELNSAAFTRAARSSAAHRAWAATAFWIFRSFVADPFSLLRRAFHRLRLRLIKN
ncbi:glycosyltransferase [Arthrobacter sp. UYCo732]|uniref:glycosyltransferase family 2 protein n=1 Tax=Arthrobacter sp. UYCo732 TaxID=3156336 RepID=UPI003395F9F3